MGEATVQTFPSVTGATLEQLTWKPEGTPRAVLQLVHGMVEHIERYDATAKRLNSEGFLVVGHNLLGHGRKAETLGWFAKSGGWDAQIEDVHALRERVQAEYPGVPYFLMGHSMGSFVVRTYCLKHEAGLQGVILSGTAHFDAPILNVGLLLANLQCAFGGEKKPSILLTNMGFAGYNRDWSPTRTTFDWLSKNTAVVDAYVADPLCGYPFTAGAYRDLFTGLKRMYPKYLGLLNKHVPVYLFSGATDPVGARGEGVKATYNELKAAGIEDVTMRLYEGGRHEMLNELERETVWDDLAAWLNAHLAQ